MRKAAAICANYDKLVLCAALDTVQGVIRKVSTSICSAGYTYATSAIVEVPRSKVNLSKLPPKCFPLEPLT